MGYKIIVHAQPRAVGSESPHHFNIQLSWLEHLSPESSFQNKEEQELYQNI